MVNRMNSIYEFQPEDAERFASFIGITARRNGDELKFKICPYCKSRKDKGTFAINLSGRHAGQKVTCSHSQRTSAFPWGGTSTLI